LVVDSSISNVTSNTVIPNHVTLSRISDRLCSRHYGEVADDSIDIGSSKAHRRILIDPKDGGMLCFHANGELYRCITLNFGARASGWYWGRVAGLMVRTSHALWQYVDDLLAWLEEFRVGLTPGGSLPHLGHSHVMAVQPMQLKGFVWREHCAVCLEVSNLHRRNASGRHCAG
jgi:hypothetical protein